MNKLFFIGYAYLIGFWVASALVIAWTFWTAWGNPDYSVRIYLNNYHEVIPETIMLMIGLILSPIYLERITRGVINGGI